MVQSTHIGKFAQAFSRAQGKMKNPKKDIESQEGYKTAPLAKFFDAVKRPFKEHGLSFSQNLSTMQELVSVTTLIMHESGQWLNSDPTLVHINDKVPLELAVYKAKRNSFCAAMGITGEDEYEDTVAGDKPKSQYASAEERRTTKQSMIDDLKQVSSPEELDQYQEVYAKDLEAMGEEDQTYISDILRDMKKLRTQFKSEKDNLKGKL